MRKLIATIGLPGSGKTTWTMQQLNDTTCRANRDAIRIAHFGRRLGTPQQEAIVTRTQDALILASYEYGYTTVIVDDTNFTTMGRLRTLANCADAQLVIKEFRTVTLETCLKRNDGRIGAERLDPQVIKDMHGKYVLPWLRSNTRENLRTKATA